MKKEKDLEQKNDRLKNRDVKTDNQQDTEIISRKELEKRGGVAGSKTDIFIAYLKLHYRKMVFHTYANNLTGLANYLYERKTLYISTHGRYRLMKYTSILNNLRTRSKKALKEIEEEDRQKEIYKSK